MADLKLQQDEIKITNCRSVYFNGKAFPVQGRIFLTNQRIVYHQINAAAVALLGALILQMLKGKYAFEIALADIENITPLKKMGNRCLSITLKNGQEYTFAVNKKWQEEIFKLLNK